MKTMNRLAAILCVLAIVAPSVNQPAVALTDAEAEKLYTEYHRSIRIYELCIKVKFTDQEKLQLGDAINARIEHKLGAKRLKLLTAAQRDGREMYSDLGCDHHDVRYYIRLFLSDLKPVLE